MSYAYVLMSYYKKMCDIFAIGTLLRITKSKLRRDRDTFLGRASGVVHVGANSGQERALYERHGLRVLWIEPIPEIFETLRANLQHYPRQSALQCLVADQDETEYAFHVSNNLGASSSILELKLHKDIWPDVAYERSITLRAITLASLLKRERINPSDFNALVIDTQGSELLVLKGTVPILHAFRFIKIEVPDFESYAGCCQLTDVEVFLKEHGFQEISRHKFAWRAKGGIYYDIVYEFAADSIGVARK